MSMFVLAVAACHAIPPVVGSVLGKTKVAVYLGSAVGFAIAIAAGAPKYALVDVIGVGVGTWIGISMLQSKGRD